MPRHKVTGDYLNNAAESQNDHPSVYLKRDGLMVRIGDFLLVNDKVRMVCGARTIALGGVVLEINWWERIRTGGTPIPDLSRRIEYPPDLVQTLE